METLFCVCRPSMPPNDKLEMLLLTKLFSSYAKWSRPLLLPLLKFVDRWQRFEKPRELAANLFFWNLDFRSMKRTTSSHENPTQDVQPTCPKMVVLGRPANLAKRCLQKFTIVIMLSAAAASSKRQLRSIFRPFAFTHWIPEWIKNQLKTESVPVRDNLQKALTTCHNWTINYITMTYMGTRPNKGVNTWPASWVKCSSYADAWNESIDGKNMRMIL